ncbi:MAG: 3-oxoacyl-ACP synthase [Fibrobacteria bacterium]|nr:3-oxoacyl-ACP synthase [Fibrobacteria bacterium]
METPAITFKLKNAVFNHCIEIITQKINDAIKSMEDAQAAANLETKSSAGDKYETGRAMMHLEKEKHGFQLQNHQKIKQVLSNIDVSQEYNIIQPGALVDTNQGLYFVGASMGEITVQNNTCLTLSLGSPLGKVMRNKAPGDAFEFRDKTFEITAVI